MKSEIIIMLTQHDKTRQDALDIFETVKDLDIKYWGFKDVGLPRDQMKQLLKNMKEAGKTTFLEVVSYSLEECLAGAKTAYELGFDYLMGTLYYQEVLDYVQSKGIQYLPFVGDVKGSPSILEGTIDGIISEAKTFVSKGIKGFDLLAYRFTGDAEALAKRFVAEVDAPVVIAGSIDSPQRLKTVSDISPFAFTMGSALFSSSFVDGGTFRQNLCQVIKLMNELP